VAYGGINNINVAHEIMAAENVAASSKRSISISDIGININKQCGVANGENSVKRNGNISSVAYRYRMCINNQRSGVAASCSINNR